MFTTIVVAVDDSDPSKSAVELACKLAKLDTAAIVLLNVVDVTKLVSVAGYETPYPAEAIETLRDAGKTLLEAAKAVCDAHNVATTLAEAEGYAADEILRVAAEQKAGLICMGTHGRKGLSHLIVGSVAEEVLQNARIPVLVTK
jgi:nucleotide-binding universal stress UspA family protein